MTIIRKSKICLSARSISLHTYIRVWLTCSLLVTVCCRMGIIFATFWPFLGQNAANKSPPCLIMLLHYRNPLLKVVLETMPKNEMKFFFLIFQQKLNPTCPPFLKSAIISTLRHPKFGDFSSLDKGQRLVYVLALLLTSKMKILGNKSI